MTLASTSIHSRSVLFRHNQLSTAPACHIIKVHKSNIASSCRSSRSSARQRGLQHNSTAASAASQEQEQASPPPDALIIENDINPDALLGVLRSTKNYTQLAAYIKSQQHVFLNSPLCVYALLHAVQLRDTIAEENFGKGHLSSEDKILQHMELVENLLDQLCEAALQYLPDLPLTTQATLALALAQLDYYDEATYAAIAAAVLAQLSPGPPDVRKPGTDGERSAELPARSAALEDLPDGLASGVLLSLIVAFSINGYYEDALMDELANQVIAFHDTFSDPAQLFSAAAVLLDLQHYHPQLLQTAAATATAALSGNSGDGMTPDSVINMLLALGFFKMDALDFVEPVIEELGSSAEELLDNLDVLQLSRLWKALLLLHTAHDVELPKDLVQVYSEAQQQDPDIFSLGRAKAAFELEDIQAVQIAVNNVMQEQWEAAGLLAPVQILQGYQNMGYEIEHKVKIPVPGFATAGQQQQQQQEGQVEAVVDLCLKLPDGQKVAILVLDESRYCNHPPNRLRGAAAVDILVLKALGLSVLPLPVAEWQLMEADEAKQQRYLQARLTAATTS